MSSNIIQIWNDINIQLNIYIRVKIRMIEEIFIILRTVQPHEK